MGKDRKELIDFIIEARRQLEGISESDTDYGITEKFRLGQMSYSWLIEEADWLDEMLGK